MLEIEQLKALVIDALEDVKASDIKVIDVEGKTSVTDVMIFATGNTSRQVKALANSVITRVKEQGVKPFGTEGEDHGEWALVDLGDIVVHIMQPSIRDFYNLEKLWGEDSPSISQDQAK
ncbi:MAG: ribosome silencing factor [Gammaproteobacteria bacterium]|nr:ribosome silencing factor [Gammaproteobacteria bacterium]MDH5776857.1 ribosome silencing factor [Gammaproteobacteria bacterium]